SCTSSAVSSRTSRIAALAARCSSVGAASAGSTLPPGNAQRPPNTIPIARRISSTLPSARRITTVAATRGVLGGLPDAANCSAIRRKYARSSAGAPANGSVMPVTLLASALGGGPGLSPLPGLRHDDRMTTVAVAVLGRGLVDPETPILRADDLGVLRG